MEKNKPTGDTAARKRGRRKEKAGKPAEYKIKGFDMVQKDVAPHTPTASRLYLPGEWAGGEVAVIRRGKGKDKEPIEFKIKGSDKLEKDVAEATPSASVIYLPAELAGEQVIVVLTKPRKKD